MLKIQELDGTLIIPTILSKEELKEELNKIKLQGGWRHKILFSNGLCTSELNVGKPWSDTPLNKIKMVERRFPDFARFGGKALDIGSNIGYNSLYLASKYNMDVTGIDVTKSHLEVSRLLKGYSNLSNLNFETDNAETFVKKEYYDLVVHFGTLYHLRNVVKALESASQNLKIGGVLLLETQCYGEPNSMLSRYVRGFNGDPSNWWALGEGALNEILKYCGFNNMIEIFRWTHPKLDGMYRVILKMDKTHDAELAYDEIV
jgi:2-polyprenyl-3-methyl-5-hydroxy-6-metoxy-1,4-benzoquinol methylase